MCACSCFACINVWLLLSALAISDVWKYYGCLLGGNVIHEEKNRTEKKYQNVSSWKPIWWHGFYPWVRVLRRSCLSWQQLAEFLLFLFVGTPVCYEVHGNRFTCSKLQASFVLLPFATVAGKSNESSPETKQLGMAERTRLQWSEKNDCKNCASIETKKT